RPYVIGVKETLDGWDGIGTRAVSKPQDFDLMAGVVVQAPLHVPSVPRSVDAKPAYVAPVGVGSITVFDLRCAEPIHVGRCRWRVGITGVRHKSRVEAECGKKEKARK